MNNVLLFDFSKININSSNKIYKNNLLQFPDMKLKNAIEVGNFVKVIKVRSPELEDFYHINDVGIVKDFSSIGLILIELDKSEVWVSKGEITKISA